MSYSVNMLHWQLSSLAQHLRDTAGGIDWHFSCALHSSKTLSNPYPQTPIWNKKEQIKQISTARSMRSVFLTHRQLRLLLLSSSLNVLQSPTARTATFILIQLTVLPTWFFYLHSWDIQTLLYIKKLYNSMIVVNDSHFKSAISVFFISAAMKNPITVLEQRKRCIIIIPCLWWADEHSARALLTPVGWRRDAVCTRELLRCHTMPAECSEASVCVLFVSLCVVPPAIWPHNVSLCGLIGPFLKSQAPFWSSRGFGWHASGLALTLHRQL